LLPGYDSELMNLRCDLAALKVKVAALKLYRQLKAYDPDQPRMPAGSPQGGQWIPSSGGGSGDATQTSETGQDSSSDSLSTVREFQIAAPISPERERECEVQFQRDIFHCNMVGLPACYDQAYLRYSNCLAGRPIPPLNY
jgi:hypothetical protein